MGKSKLYKCLKKFKHSVKKILLCCAIVLLIRAAIFPNAVDIVIACLILLSLLILYPHKK